MTRRIAALALFLAFACTVPALAAGGGAVVGPVARGFSVTPASVAPDAPLTFALRAAAPARRVQARVDVLAPGRPAVRARLGLIRSGRAVRVAWTPPAGALPAGAYTARLVLTGRGAHAARAYVRAPLTVVVPPPPAAVFPVQGPYTYGGPGARFGASRSGHVHQGQDVIAAAGTPVVSPVGGAVHRTAYQATGAGYYVVVTGADGRDYVFMHFQEGSTAVAEGRPVAAGQRIGAVGATGDAQGPHLHIEIWPDGWWASDASQPIDPLPDLLAWAG